MDKRGVSEVVATVLIIMIVVAAVGILWATLYPMIKNNIQSGTSCFNAQNDVSLLIEGYTCLNESNNGTVFVNVRKGNDDSFVLAGLSIILMKGGESKILTIDETIANGQTRVFNKTGTIDDKLAGYTGIQIAPIIQTGNLKKTCDPVGEQVVLPKCL